MFSTFYELSLLNENIYLDKKLPKKKDMIAVHRAKRNRWTMH